MNKKLTPLFEPFKLSENFILKNRFIMAPMTRNMAPNNIPTEDMAKYYARRAKGGVGLIITEGTMINRAGHGDDNLPAFYGKEALAGWQKVVDEVHAVGGKIAPQLWHLGSLTGVGVSAAKHPNSDIQPRAMTTAEIEQTIQDYAIAAKNAKELGFDAIELHGAHGYLIDQFFWSVTNTRTDKYGGKTLPERLTFAVEVLQAVRKAVGDDFPIILRLSQWKMGKYDETLVETEEALAAWLQPLAKAGVDIFHMSTRRFWHAAFKDTDETLAALARNVSGKPVIAVGNMLLENDYVATNKLASDSKQNFDNIYHVADSVRDNKFDLAAIGRMLITNPNLVNDIEANNCNKIKTYQVEDLERLL